MSTVTIPTLHSQSVPADPDTPSILTLPAEIRNLIYEILLVFEDVLTIFPILFERIYDEMSWDMIESHTTTKTPISGVLLLATCRKIHSEAAGVLYSLSRFLLTSKFYIQLATLIKKSTI